MKYQIRGSTLPILDVQLDEGETIFTESGGMAWMSNNIEMESKMEGGLFKGLKRGFTGESLFLVNYTCTSGKGIIAFCHEMPGRIIPFELKEGEKIICQRDAFMMAEKSVDLDMELVKRFGAGFFGGEGFFLQKLQGPGKAFIELAGEITEYELEENQTLKVDPGYIGAFETSVSYDIQRIKGIKNIFFGGEGLFLATLTGPGKVWLQSMPLSNLAQKLSPYLATKRS